MMKKLLLTTFLLLTFHSIFGQVSYAGAAETVSYDEAEVKPEYLGGYKEFIKFIGENYKAPEVEGLSGVIRLSFVIEINGRVTNIKVIKDIGGGAGEEGIRVLKSCPIWSPGEIDGQRVRVKMEIPITLRN